jgi:flagellar hook-basal body complex protein FliE
MNNISVDNVLAQMRALSESAKNSSMATPSEQSNGANFSNLLQDSLAQVNELQSSAKAMKTSFESGDTETSLAEVMVAVQTASISFEAVTAVRNKLLTAYQEIMNMPV